MLNTIERKVSEIKPYKRNSKKHSTIQIKNVAESIRQFGFRQPIVLDKDDVIIIGHCRYEAAKLLNMETVPCNIAAELSKEQVRKLRNLDNKLNESEWDFDLLREDISDLDFSDFDIDWDLPEVENKSEIIEDEAPEVDEENEPITQLGDIWELGEHRLMCGDSTNKATLEKLMNGKKADLVFTDPPYGMSVVSRSGVLSKMYTTDILNDDTNKVAIASFMLSQKKFSQAKQVWWGANYYTETLPSAECWIVWDKNNGASDQMDCELAWTNFRSVVRQFTLASEKTNRVHPTQKPVELITKILYKFDKDKQFNIVVDLFGGSGSTLIACEQLGRRCYMMELSPKYCDVIIKRWEKLTGEKAVRINVESGATADRD